MIIAHKYTILAQLIYMNNIMYDLSILVSLYFISVILCALSILIVPKEKLYKVYKSPMEIVFVSLFPIFNIIALMYHIKISRDDN